MRVSGRQSLVWLLRRSGMDQEGIHELLEEAQAPGPLALPVSAPKGLVAADEARDLLAHACFQATRDMSGARVV